MQDYLKSSGTEPSIELDKDHYQLIKDVGFFLYIDKKSDIVIKFDYFQVSQADKVSISVIQKDIVICQYSHPIDPTLKFKYFYGQWLEYMVFIAQTSFYFLLEQRERDDVVAYLNAKDGCSIRVQTINNSFSDSPCHVFVSMSICNYKFNPLKTEIFASLNTNADGRLMVSSDAAFIMDNTTRKLVKRYTIKKMQHYNSLNNDVHYYEFTLAGDKFGRVMILYDMKKKKATFSLLTYLHGEPVIKKRHVLVEPDTNYQMNILNELERTYLGKYPSESLIEHFKEWHMDISNGLKKDHLTVLEMFEI